MANLQLSLILSMLKLSINFLVKTIVMRGMGNPVLWYYLTSGKRSIFWFHFKPYKPLKDETMFNFNTYFNHLTEVTIVIIQKGKVYLWDWEFESRRCPCWHPPHMTLSLAIWCQYTCLWIAEAGDKKVLLLNRTQSKQSWWYRYNVKFSVQVLCKEPALPVFTFYFGNLLVISISYFF